MHAKTALETLEDVAAVATLALGILTAIYVGGQAALAVFVIGWLLVVPIADELADRMPEPTDERTTTPTDTDGTDTTSADPVETLRERYAAGEIDEAEFERRIEHLVATEGVEVPPELDARLDARADADTVETDARRDGDRAPDRDPAVERET